jgi:hypothetical protein
MNGYGKLDGPGEETSYMGQFKRGKKEGFGEYFVGHGSKRYRGYWQNDMKNGEGYVRG